MFGRFSSSSGYVGVDFGARGIKMLQVAEHGGQLHVVGAARIDVPLLSNGTQQSTNAAASTQPAAPTAQPPADPHWLAEQIRAAFTTGGFTGRKCVVSLARHDVFMQSVRLPKMPDAELRQTVMWEAAQRFGLDRNAMEVDFIRTGATLATGENREEIILVAASHSAIHARVEPLLEAGLRPVAVDTGFAALVRSFSRRVRREADQSLIRAVVEIGFTGSTILVLRGDQIAFCKPLTVSGERLNRAVAEHLQMTIEEAAELRQARMERLCGSGSAVAVEIPDLYNPAVEGQGGPDDATDRAVYAAVRPLLGELAREITMCLRYYGVTFRGTPPERLILTGGDAMEPKLDQIVTRACNLPVAFDDAPGALGGLIGEIHASLNRSPRPAPCWAVALGLSLRGVGNRKSERRGGHKGGSTVEPARSDADRSDDGVPSGPPSLANRQPSFMVTQEAAQ